MAKKKSLSPEEYERGCQDVMRDLRVMAMMPPSELVSMRNISLGVEPRTDMERAMRKEMLENVTKFTLAKANLEHRYRQDLIQLEEKWGEQAKGVERLDGGCEKLKKLILELMDLKEMPDTKVSEGGGQ